MKRLALTAATFTALALPASALADSSDHGVVLSAHGHAVQVVNSAHTVGAYTIHGQAPKLTPGSVISFADHGAAISDVRVTGHQHTVSYYASVVKTSSSHVELRLADGRTVNFSAGQMAGHKASHSKHDRAAIAHAASGSGVTINIQGLAPGATVLVTEAVGSDGSLTVSITLPAATAGSGSGTGSAGTPGDQTIDGVVSDVEDDTFTVQTSDGSSLVFHMDPTALNNIGMFPCDTVIVSYHEADNELIADNVDDNGTSDTGDCSDGGEDSGDGSDSGNSSDEVGPITSISNTSITIDTSDQGSMTFAVDPSEDLTEGFLVGDVVDVTYSPDPNGGNDATDIEYVENDESGVVTAVSAGSITFTDDTTGQPDTFTADPSEQMFQGVDVGDEVDVTYHVSNGQDVVDNVDDLTDDAAAGN
jgi:hypothetical protein